MAVLICPVPVMCRASKKCQAIDRQTDGKFVLHLQIGMKPRASLWGVVELEWMFAYTV